MLIRQQKQINLKSKNKPLFMTLISIKKTVNSIENVYYCLERYHHIKTTVMNRINADTYTPLIIKKKQYCVGTLVSLFLSLSFSHFLPGYYLRSNNHIIVRKKPLLFVIEKDACLCEKHISSFLFSTVINLS